MILYVLLADLMYIFFSCNFIPLLNCLQMLFLDIQPWQHVEFRSDTALAYSVILHNIVYVVPLAEFPAFGLNCLNTKLGIISYQLYYAILHT